MNETVHAGAQLVTDWLGKTGWQAGVLILLVAAVHATAGRWIAPRWRHAMWLIVVARLLMPATLETRWSLFNLHDPFADATVRPVPPAASPAAVHTGGVTVTVTKSFPPVDETHAQLDVAGAGTPTGISWRVWLAGVWLAGAVIVLSRCVACHLRLRRRLRRATPANEALVALVDDVRRELGVRTPVEARLTDAVAGPALFGFVRPTLLIPPSLRSSLPTDEMRLIVLHELAHVRRRDLWVSAFFTLAQAVHWFHPLVWFALSRARAERELACDAIVLERSDTPARRRYGETMLTLAAQLRAAARPRFAPAIALLPARSQLHRRIDAIARFRPPSRRASWVSVMLVLALTSCTLTDKKQPAPPAEDATPPVRAADVPSPLDRKLPEVRLEKMGFADAVDYLRDVSDTTLFVNWRALEAAEIRRDAPVTARLRNATLGKALDTVLADVGGNRVKLGYIVEDGVVMISTQADLPRDSLTRVYDVRELVTEIPDFEPPDFATTRPATPTTRAAANPLPATRAAGETSEVAFSQQLLDELTTLVRETIDPDGWNDGPNGNTLRTLNGHLVVTAPDEVHGQIGQLLAQLREPRSLQMTVEARFIQLDPSALPEPLREKLLPGGDARAVGAAERRLLGDAEVKEVLKAMQAQADATVLTAPRITIFNGQRAYVQVTTETAYVSGFNALKSNEGETAYEPEMAVVSSGLLFDVQGAMSADRTSAVLKLHPKLTNLVRMDAVPFEGAPAEKDLKVQVPVVEAREVETIATVPDGKTLVVAGLTGRPAAKPATTTILLVKPTLITPEKPNPTPAR